MAAREIAGPQDRYEHQGPLAPYRDIRPLAVRLRRWLAGQGSALVLAGMAGATVAAPGVVDLTAAAGALYAVWVLTRRVEAPLRLPRTSGLPDWSDVDSKTRRPRRAAGDEFIGWCVLTGKEIWQNDADARQHGSVPGITGSGKSKTLLGSHVNTLAKGSGFINVDGKATAEAYGETYVLCRRFALEDGLRVVNLLTASLPAEATAHGHNPRGQTNSFNPLATGNAEALAEMLSSQLGEAPANDGNGVFRERAVALVRTISPPLVWMRDNKGVPIDIETVRVMVELKSIWSLATRRVFLARDPGTGKAAEIAVPDMPEEIVYPLLAYLGEIPGYDTGLPYNKQKTDEPFKQHGFALFYFTATFTQLAVSLGHIFKVRTGDIEMRDTIMNRRILLVNLPALEKSDETLAALGRIVIASLRAMMAQLLGAKLEGDPREIFAHKPGMGIAPYRVDYDEVGYYATSGMDRQLAMGRGINMAFRIAFQELGSLWARLGEKTLTLLGNASLTYGMKQKEAQRTREWLEKTAGQAWVTQATSYQGAGSASYREAQSAEMRQVNRVDWQDFQAQTEGEAILLTGAKRVYARLFYHPFEVTGRPRLNRPLMLAVPDPAAVRGPAERAARVRARIEEGLLSDGREPPPDGVLGAMAAALAAAAAAGATTQGCIAAALDAAGRADAALAATPGSAAPPAAGEGEEERPDPEGSKDRDGPEGSEGEGGNGAGSGRRLPVTEFTPMLDVASGQPPNGPGRAGRPREPVDEGLLAALTAIEAAAGARKTDAAAAARATLAERDAALAAAPLPDTLPAADGELPALLERVNARLAAFGAGARDGAGRPGDGWSDAAEWTNAPMNEPGHAEVCRL